MNEIDISLVLPVAHDQLYKMWLSSKYHTEFTGGAARINAKAGARFTAWDGYINGKNLELIPGKFIKQTWRTAEFDLDQPYSVLELFFEEKEKGKTRLRLHHYNLTKADVMKYKKGWKEFYFAPMKIYFTTK